MKGQGFEAHSPTAVLQAPLTRQCQAHSFPIFTAPCLLDLYPKLWVTRDLQSEKEQLLPCLSTVLSYAPTQVSQEPEGQGRGQLGTGREDFSELGMSPAQCGRKPGLPYTPKFRLLPEDLVG